MRFDGKVGIRPMWLALLVLGAVAAGGVPAQGAAAPADTVYRNGLVYTVDAHDSVRQALAIRGGRIVYVGSNEGLAPFVGEKTRVFDLHGRMLMPGLVDGHMHPLQGGAALLKCSLNYEQLSIGQMQTRIQACLDATKGQEPDGWLEVVNWFQEGMVPAGVVTNSADAGCAQDQAAHPDSVLLRTFLAGQFARPRDRGPEGRQSRIRSAARSGAMRQAIPPGLLDDAAQALVSGKMPSPTPEDDVKSAQAALDAMRKQGITTFLDAAAERPALEAFSKLRRDGQLTARAHFALLITPAEGRDPATATAKVVALSRRYDEGALRPEPGITARNVKLFLDGVITAPAMSGAMLQPYFTPGGAGDSPGRRGKIAGRRCISPRPSCERCSRASWPRGSSPTCTPTAIGRCARASTACRPCARRSRTRTSAAR